MAKLPNLADFSHPEHTLPPRGVRDEVSVIAPPRVSGLSRKTLFLHLQDVRHNVLFPPPLALSLSVPLLPLPSLPLPLPFSLSLSLSICKIAFLTGERNDGMMPDVTITQQSWALPVFFHFFTNKKGLFCIFYQVNNQFLHQSYLKSPLPVKLTW